MACVVAADVLFLLVERSFGGGQSAIICVLVEFVSLGTSDKHSILIDITEGRLGSKNMGGPLREDLLSDTLWLVPLPNVHILVRDVC